MKSEVSSRNDCTMVLVYIRSLREARVGIEDVNTQQEHDIALASNRYHRAIDFLAHSRLILKSFRKGGRRASEGERHPNQLKSSRRE